MFLFSWGKGGDDPNWFCKGGHDLSHCLCSPDVPGDCAESTPGVPGHRGIVELTNPISTVVMERDFPNQARRCTRGEADDAASRVWGQETLQDPNGRGGEGDPSV